MLELILGQRGLQFANFLAQADSEMIETIAANGVSTSAVWIPLFVILLGAVSYLILQEGVVRSKALFAVGIFMALVTAGIAAGLMPASLDSYVTYAFCALAVGGAIGFLSAREPVYAALGFATAVLSTCGILFMQSALYIAAATMIVYAGSTIIIFLFVLMFAQRSTLRPYDINLTSPYVATAIGTVMLVAITTSVIQAGAIPERKPDQTRPLSEATTTLKAPPVLAKPVAETAEGDAEEAVEKVASEEAIAIIAPPTELRIPETTAELGRSLYTDYLLAVQMAGVILLVATAGAIALATRTTDEVAR